MTPRISVAVLLVAAFAQLQLLPLRLCRGGRPCRAPLAVARVLAGSILGGALCLVLALITLGSSVEAITRPLAALLSTCDRSLHVAYRIPGGPVGVATALATAGLLLERLARGAARRHRAVRSTRRTARDIVALGSAQVEGACAVVVPSTTAAAWCVPGPLGRGRRLATVVVTSAAVHRLDPGHLHAVLDHEQAHLRQHHQRLLAVSTVVHEALPRLPGLRRAAIRMPELLEMAADDSSAARHGRRTLAAALLALASVGGAPGPAGALAAGSSFAARRVERLLAEEARERCREGRVAGTVGRLIAALAVLAPLALVSAPAARLAVERVCFT